MDKWKTTKSTYLVNDKWLKLRADSCLTADGHVVEPYYVFEYGDWVNCLVLDTDNNVVMVRQYRHGIKDYVLELPGGGIDKSDASPLAAVTRELEEELGYTGGKIYQTGVSYANPSSHTNKIYAFIAVGGSCSKEQKLEASESLRVEKMPLNALQADLESPDGETYQSSHIATLFFGLQFLKKNTK